MSADPRRVKELFGAAAAIPDHSERAALLARECGDDRELRQRLDALLAAHDHPKSALDRPLAVVATDPDRTVDHRGGPSQVGDLIDGRYKLLERIGEGGMGEVWVADQLDPIRRRVALKMIKPGMDSRSVLARFEAERQALALMDHPNVAKVFDAGTTADGRPFFVMELVKGTPITEFCDKRKLAPRERLGLFVPVCQAIQHAHHKGIIHRDIKPSNVLIALHDETPVPKVIDFGVAKAVGQQLTEKTLYTGFGALVGTPAYMAPEQATFNQLDIDTRADVYALGVLLYELLAGSPPVEPERLKRAALDEVLRLVREEEPPRPSARLSTSQSKATIAAVRQSDPGKLSALMKGELDWIVMKALEKDRTRRYETANGFAADVQRYLAGEPVQAVPPSVGYRLRKAYRRNKAAVLVAGAFVGLVTFGGLAAAYLAVRATEAERAASAERDAALTAQAEANDQRDAAESAREGLRRSLYASDLQAANTAWEAYDARRVLDSLDRHRPAPGETDLRGFEWHFLNRQCRSEVRSLLVTPGPGYLSPDGSRLFIVPTAATDEAGKPHTLRVWDLTREREFAEFQPFVGTERRGRLCRFSDDGKRVAVAGLSRGEIEQLHLKVFDADTRQELFDETIPTPKSSARFELSADGSRLAIQSSLEGQLSHAVTVWDVATRKPLQQVTRHTRALARSGSSIALRPDGERLALRLEAEQPEKESDNDLQILDVKTGKVVTSHSLGNESVSGLRYSPDGKTLAYSLFSRDTVILREAETGRVVGELEGASGTTSRDQVRHITFSPDGSWLCCHVLQQTQLRLWHVPTGKAAMLRMPHRVLPLPDSPRSVAFSADNRFLTVSCTDGTVRTWAVSESESAIQAGPPSGKRLNIASAAAAARFAAGWDVADGDRTRLEVRVWDETGRVLFTHRDDSRESTAGHLHDLRLSPDGNRLALAISLWKRDGTRQVRNTSFTRLQVWDVATGKLVFTRESDRGEFYPFAFSSDGRWLAATRTTIAANREDNDSGRLSVWNLDSDREEFGRNVVGTPRMAAISADGRRVAWTVRVVRPLLHDVVTVCDLPGGKELWRLDDIRLGLNAPPAFSPDGRVVAVLTSRRSVSTTAEIRLLNAADGTPAGPTLMSRRGGVVQMQFTPDGKRLFGYDYVFGGESGEARAVIWDTTTGRELLNTPCPNAQWFSLTNDSRVFWLIRRNGTEELYATTWDTTPRPEPKK